MLRGNAVGKEIHNGQVRQHEPVVTTIRELSTAGRIRVQALYGNVLQAALPRSGAAARPQSAPASALHSPGNRSSRRIRGEGYSVAVESEL